MKIFEPIPIRKNKSTKRDFKDFHIDTSKYRDNKNKVVGFYGSIVVQNLIKKVIMDCGDNGF